jgi:hypothetical protein
VVKEVVTSKRLFVEGQEAPMVIKALLERRDKALMAYRVPKAIPDIKELKAHLELRAKAIKALLECKAMSAIPDIKELRAHLELRGIWDPLDLKELAA